MVSATLRRVCTVVASVTCAGVTVAATAPLADAAPDPAVAVTARTVTVDVEPGQGAATAGCNEGERLTGGGVVPASADQRVKTFGSAPDQQGGWHADIFNGTERAVEVEVTALCLRPGDVEVRVSERTVHRRMQAGQRSLTSPCKADEQATGGGVVVGSINSLDKIFGSAPNGRGWRADVFVAAAGGIDVWVTAICARTDAGPLPVATRSDHAQVLAGGQSTFALCKPGEVVVGGGAVIGSIGGQDRIVGHTADGQAWRADIANNTGHAIHAWTYAQCLRVA